MIKEYCEKLSKRLEELKDKWYKSKLRRELK
jgi:hypothetical protein